MLSTKYKTRYEKTRIISARSLQLSQGSPAMIKVPKGVTKPIDIATLEWEKGLIPIDIKRTPEKAQAIEAKEKKEKEAKK